MKYFEKIKGDRIYLSPMNLEDVEIYTKWLNDMEITDKLGSSMRMSNLSNEKKYIEENMNGYNFSIILREKDQLIGNVSLMDVDTINRKATLGIFIGDKENRSKGYGKEAIKLILDYGFNTLNLNNVMLWVYDFNKNAIKTYESVGFKKIGTRRSCAYVNGNTCDEVFMDILKEEFNK